jgi:hypothetical protein
LNHIGALLGGRCRFSIPAFALSTGADVTAANIVGRSSEAAQASISVFMGRTPATNYRLSRDPLRIGEPEPTGRYLSLVDRLAGETANRRSPVLKRWTWYEGEKRRGGPAIAVELGCRGLRWGERGDGGGGDRTRAGQPFNDDCGSCSIQEQRLTLPGHEM